MRRLAPLLAALALAGCGGGDDAPGRADASPSPPAQDCAEARPDTPVAAPRRLIAPPGTEFATVERREDGTAQAEGFVALAPDAFVAYFDERDDVAVLYRESEGSDAEVQFSDTRTRSFWVLRRACPDGSRFTVVYDEELAPGIIRDQIEGREPAG